MVCHICIRYGCSLHTHGCSLHPIRLQGHASHGVLVEAGGGGRLSANRIRANSGTPLRHRRKPPTPKHADYGSTMVLPWAYPGPTMAGVGVMLSAGATTQLQANEISECEGGGVHVVGASTTEVSSELVSW